MIQADDFLDPAGGRGFDFYSGVPCSILQPFINRVIGSPHSDYIGATQEGEAVAIAAGAWLAGRKTVVMCQNSGLGNCVNPLASLNFPFKIPTLLIATWRAQPGVKDEPQHQLMGTITHSLMETLRLRCMPFPHTADEVAACLDAAESVMEEGGLPVGLVMEKGAVAPEPLDQAPLQPKPRCEVQDLLSRGQPVARMAALERILAGIPGAAAVIATTGKSGRELFTLADREQHFYLVGSMGCASGLGLGVALNSSRPVILLDGDGAALMSLGNMATIGARGLGNLIHIVLDNGVHDSTGGQATVSPNVEFAHVARALGYGAAYACDDLAGLEQALAASLAGDETSFIHLRMAPGSIDNLGRPTVAPPDVARRFKDFLKDS